MSDSRPVWGYLNRLLTVDLSSGDCRAAPLERRYVEEYLGGRGLAARYLLDLLPAGVDPLAPGNVAILMTGPFAATEVYSCHRYEWVTKSPLTGTYLCCSCGGGLGVALRQAGYDGLVLTGASPRPVYLWVDEAGAQVRDAAFLWGRTVTRTQGALRGRLGAEVAVGCIGPAGELPEPVLYAGYYDGQRSAGRGGLGAVLGSKGLKAIAVRPGRAAVPVRDPTGLAGLLPDIARQLQRHRVTGEALPQAGSMVWLDALALNGLLPARNYQMAMTYAAIQGQLDSETYRTRFAQAAGGPDTVSCHRCPLQSGKRCTPDQGSLRGQTVRGPEFQSAWALGVNCGVLDFRPVIAAYAACNDLGLDAVSAGGAIGFAMECCQRGVLDPERIARDYGGLRLEWGSCAAVVRLIDIVAGRQGWLGALLAQGVRRASARLAGSESFALHVKGMELPGFDPRGCWSMGLAYATSCRGACHLKGWTAEAELAGGVASSTEGKARMVVDAENHRAAVDSVLICAFASRVLTESWMVRLLRAVTGLELGEADIAATGARVCDLERRLAQAQGLTAAEDWLPARLLHDPVRGGEYDGMRIGADNLGRMRTEYYQLRGWDRDGVAGPALAGAGSAAAGT